MRYRVVKRPKNYGDILLDKSPFCYHCGSMKICEPLFFNERILMCWKCFEKNEYPIPPKIIEQIDYHLKHDHRKDFRINEQIRIFDVLAPRYERYKRVIFGGSDEIDIYGIKKVGIFPCLIIQTDNYGYKKYKEVLLQGVRE